MKKVLFLLLLMSAGVAGFAQRVSHCTIYSDDGYKFTVFLNGEKKNEVPQASVRIINLTQPYYSIRIEFEDAGLEPITKKLFQLTDAYGSPVDATHVIRRNRKGELGLHWKSQSTWPEYIHAQPTVVVTGGGTTTVRQTTSSGTSPDGVQVNIGGPGGNVSFGTGRRGASEQTTTTTTVAAPAGAASGCTGTVLNEPDFAGALKSISARSTPEGKLMQARQIISSNCFQMPQVRRILQLFPTDEQKLELAKLSYTRTLDQGNYYKLNDVFASEATIDALNKAITGQ